MKDMKLMKDEQIRLILYGLDEINEYDLKLGNNFYYMED